MLESAWSYVLIVSVMRMFELSRDLRQSRRPTEVSLTHSKGMDSRDGRYSPKGSDQSWEEPFSAEKFRTDNLCAAKWQSRGTCMVGYALEISHPKARWALIGRSPIKGDHRDVPHIRFLWGFNDTFPRNAGQAMTWICGLEGCFICLVTVPAQKSTILDYAHERQAKNEDAPHPSALVSPSIRRLP
jgi:hypothetical protein